MKEDDIIVSLVMTNSQLAKMITNWSICKHLSTVSTAFIACATILLFILCFTIPAHKHFYKKILISIVIFISCTLLLNTSSQIRYHDSQEVAAFQKIQINRKLGTKIPEEKRTMRKDNKVYKKYENTKHPSLKLYTKAKHDKKQYTYLHHLLYERQLFNQRNNHVKDTHWYDKI